MNLLAKSRKVPCLKMSFTNSSRVGELSRFISDVKSAVPLPLFIEEQLFRWLIVEKRRDISSWVMVCRVLLEYRLEVDVSLYWSKDSIFNIKSTSRGKGGCVHIYRESGHGFVLEKALLVA